MLLCFLAMNLFLSLTTLSFRILMTTFTRFSLPLAVLILHFSDRGACAGDGAGE